MRGCPKRALDREVCRDRHVGSLDRLLTIFNIYPCRCRQLLCMSCLYRHRRNA